MGQEETEREGRAPHNDSHKGDAVFFLLQFGPVPRPGHTDGRNEERKRPPATARRTVPRGTPIPQDGDVRVIVQLEEEKGVVVVLLLRVLEPGRGTTQDGPLAEDWTKVFRENLASFRLILTQGTALSPIIRTGKTEDDVLLSDLSIRCARGLRVFGNIFDIQNPPPENESKSDSDDPGGGVRSPPAQTSPLYYPPGPRHTLAPPSPSLYNFKPDYTGIHYALPRRHSGRLLVETPPTSTRAGVGGGRSSRASTGQPPDPAVTSLATLSS
ncbi:hypothetical protein Pcinc_018233 [Petrolisthes cinctipes]|uniref:Uncharacterized protein n=1 Tax=Petrolisthes cinctipes TaxID=88211 RepID=A0AAE1FMI1_PETCI|nr:hypothetical protein Pcinc_018233 [Petrolisthes cinctipes]